MSHRRDAIKVALLAFGSALFLALAPLLFQTRYAQHVMIVVLLYVALSSAWNILGGFAGQLSLGHAAFFGIGAYAAAILSSKSSISPWWAVLLGPAAALLAALIIGGVCFRLRGPYFALATIAIGEVTRLLALNWRALTGGAVGIVIRPSVFSGTSKIPYYYIALILALSSVALSRWLRSSRLGYFLMAIREDEGAAESLGIDAARCKLAALTMSAALTALGGAFYANYFLFVDPSIVLPLSLSVEIALMAIIGGLGTVWGPALGAALLKLSSEAFRNAFEQANLLIYGLLLMAVILFMPGGLVGRSQEKIRT
jgi:branched-chain amino acid transport system permease protein